MKNKDRHITLPGGFVAAAAECGLKSKGEDLTIIAAERDAAAALVTTRNQVVGAPVIWCRSVMPGGCGTMRGIVVNSGCSNVCTGKAGLADAKTMATLAGKHLGCKAEKVLVASTGIIGHRLNMAKVRKGIAAAGRNLGRKNDSAVVRAIMTTDLRPKSAVVQIRIGGKLVTVAGIAKGSGMIAPSLATMISVITTDAAISPAALGKALKAAVATSFNAVTVDSDTSTSDTVALFASGAAGNRPLATGSAAYKKFASAVQEVCDALARQIAADGEGATKTIEITVCGAKSDSDAQLAAKSVADSPLLKCAVHGCDPNWGRIVMALGKSRAKVVAEKLSVKIGPTAIFARGMPKKFNAAKVSKYLAGKEVTIDCDLGIGGGSFTALTCDLSREYIAINADYHT